MKLLDRFKHESAVLNEDTADQLEHPAFNGHVIEVRPPRNHGTADITTVLRSLRKPRKTYLGLKNTSPIITFEIVRSGGRLRFQYTVPTATYERELRSQLHTVIPAASFHEAKAALPVTKDRAIAGGILTTGRQSWYPLYTNHSQPVTNAIAASLHGDAMARADVTIQILARARTTDRLRSYYRGRRTGTHINHLKKEKEHIWGSRKPTSRERSQARLIEEKMRSPLWQASIRVLTISSPDNKALPARFYETVTGYSRMEHDDTGQYLRPSPVKTWRESQLINYATAIAHRQFNGWSRWFYATSRELGALMAPPSIRQPNIPASRA
jgi:hypothetical protein